MPDLFSSGSLIGFSILIVFASISNFYPDGAFSIFRGYITAPHKDPSTASPYSSSWNTWFNPSHRTSNYNPSVPESDGWNLYYHLGGYGPWIEKLDGPTQDIKPPAGCHVEQAHMVVSTSIAFH
jgi:acid phosphatase